MMVKVKRRDSRSVYFFRDNNLTRSRTVSGHLSVARKFPRVITRSVKKHGANNYLTLYGGVMWKYCIINLLCSCREKFTFSTFFFPLGKTLTTKPRLIKDWPVIMNQESQCQAGSVSPSSHKSIYWTSLCVPTWLEKKRPVDTLFASLSLLKLTLSLGERETVFGTAWLHFLLEWTPGPKGTPETDLHATCYSLLPVANLLLWQVASPTATWRTFQT